MTDKSPSEADIRAALDIVWGELTVSQSRELDPEVRAICQANHEFLHHSEGLPWFHPHHFADPAPPQSGHEHTYAGGVCTRCFALEPMEQ